LINATNVIISVFHKGAEANGIDTSMKELTATFTTEVDKIKEGLDTNLTNPVQKATQDIEDLTGPIKRQL
jgi:sec-independent protein translocase protein TatA